MQDWLHLDISVEMQPTSHSAERRTLHISSIYGRPCIVGGGRSVSGWQVVDEDSDEHDVIASILPDGEMDTVAVRFDLRMPLTYV